MHRTKLEKKMKLWPYLFKEQLADDNKSEGANEDSFILHKFQYCHHQHTSVSLSQQGPNVC